MTATTVNIKRTALRSGFFLFDSCIKVDNSDVSNWAVMFSVHPLASSKERLPHVKSHTSHFEEGDTIESAAGIVCDNEDANDAIRVPKPEKYS